MGMILVNTQWKKWKWYYEKVRKEIFMYMLFLFLFCTRNTQEDQLKKYPSIVRHKPPHDKTNKMIYAPSELRSAWSAQSDQSPQSAHRVAKNPSFLHADSEDSDQTGLMPRLLMSLRWVQRSFCCFVMRQRINQDQSSVCMKRLWILGCTRCPGKTGETPQTCRLICLHWALMSVCKFCYALAQKYCWKRNVNISNSS